MLRPITSRYPALTLPEFELSPIGRQGNGTKKNSLPPNIITKDKCKSLATTYGSFATDQPSSYSISDSNNIYSDINDTENGKIELSTWIGDNKTSLEKIESGFSQWLDPNNGNFLFTHCLRVLRWNYFDGNYLGFL